MQAELVMHVVEEVGLSADCTGCAKRARYCTCPDGPTVRLEALERILPDIRVWCEEFHMDML